MALPAAAAAADRLSLLGFWAWAGEEGRNIIKTASPTTATEHKRLRRSRAQKAKTCPKQRLYKIFHGLSLARQNWQKVSCERRAGMMYGGGIFKVAEAIVREKQAREEEGSEVTLIMNFSNHNQEKSLGINLDFLLAFKALHLCLTDFPSQLVSYFLISGPSSNRYNPG